MPPRAALGDLGARPNNQDGRHRGRMEARSSTPLPGGDSSSDKLVEIVSDADQRPFCGGFIVLNASAKSFGIGLSAGMSLAVVVRFEGIFRPHG
jgi:hypothetical protein